MSERLTDRARRVMKLADREARRFRHEYVGTEHVLLGIVNEASGVAANVLKNLDVDLHKIQMEVEKIVQHGPGGEQFGVGWLPQTPWAKKVLDYAAEEARCWEHNYVGTEHLLLGLLREERGLAAQVLTNLGLKLEDVREEILNLLGHTEKIPKALQPESTEIYTVSDLTPADSPRLPEPLTDEQIGLIHERIRLVEEQKGAFVAEQDFVQAARLRSEEVALKLLLAWYQLFRDNR